MLEQFSPASGMVLTVSPSEHWEVCADPPSRIVSGCVLKHTDEVVSCRARRVIKRRACQCATSNPLMRDASFPTGMECACPWQCGTGAACALLCFMLLKFCVLPAGRGSRVLASGVDRVFTIFSCTSASYRRECSRSALWDAEREHWMRLCWHAFPCLPGPQSVRGCSASALCSILPRRTCLRLILFCICPPLCAEVLWPMPAWVWRDVRSVFFFFFLGRLGVASSPRSHLQRKRNMVKYPYLERIRNCNEPVSKLQVGGTSMMHRQICRGKGPNHEQAK